MKKIAFFMCSMNVAGIEKSVQRMINRLLSFDDKLDITLYLVKNEGQLLNELDKKCNICKLPIKPNDADLLMAGGFKATFLNYLKHCRFGNLIKIAYRRLIKKRLDWDLIDWDSIPISEVEYDYAVCCTAHMPFLVRFVSEKVQAKKRILFIHSDFSINKYKIQLLNKYIDSYTQFCCVSQSLLSQFVTIFPYLKKRSIVVHNYFPGEQIYRMSQKNIATSTYSDEENVKNLLTVGNFTPEKGHDLAFKCIRQLEKHNYKYTWTFIGNGLKARRYQRIIEKHRLDNIRILTGVTNPYPYFARCDLYIQTSKTEGYCTTVLEAKSFNKPIICTDVPGSHELLDNYKTGTILKTNGCNELLSTILNHTFLDNSAKFNYKDYNEEIDKIIKTIFML